MSLTAGLPLRHPAIWISALILGLGYFAIGIEEVQKSTGLLPASTAKLVMSVIGLPVWTWMMLTMIGRPDLYIDKRPSPTDWDAVDKRERIVQRFGYLLQGLTLAATLAAIWRWL